MVDRAALTKKLRRAVVGPVRRAVRNPFRAELGRPVLVHCSHHKAGTVWFRRVLRRVTDEYGLRFELAGPGEQAAAARGADLAFYAQAGTFYPKHLGGRPFRGSHIVREIPHDIAVSGYHYHLRTDEPWVLRPRDEYDGRSYQEHLKAFNPHDGLLAEIRRLATSDLTDVARWDFGRPYFLELRYEDVLDDEPAQFGRLFAHYGFRDEAIGRSVDIALGMTLDKVRESGDEKTKAHLRSGQPGEWRDVFSEDHKILFKELTGRLLVDMGYERDENW